MTRLFFATDIHGSEKCFGKFLNSGKFYKADTLILGGDITGKMIVPILATAKGGWTCRLLGADHEVGTEEELLSLEKKIRFSGYYPFLTTQSEMDELSASESRLDQVFSELMIETLKRWMRLAARQTWRCWRNS